MDSRLVYINYEAFLVPMLDFHNFRQDETTSQRQLKAKFDENKQTEIKTNDKYAIGQQVFENLGLNSDNLLLYHGLVLQDNPNDCFSLSVSFAEKNDDQLKEERKVFFGRYFMFDRNYLDMM